MNEILKKRIEEACISGSKQYSDTSKYSKVGYLRGFNEGAEYALSHQWISVDEALPEDEEHVLALVNGVPIVAKGIHVKENLKYITHWMPIPKFDN